MPNSAPHNLGFDQAAPEFKRMLQSKLGKLRLLILRQQISHNSIGQIILKSQQERRPLNDKQTLSFILSLRPDEQNSIQVDSDICKLQLVCPAPTPNRSTSSPELIMIRIMVADTMGGNKKTFEPIKFSPHSATNWQPENWRLVSVGLRRARIRHTLAEELRMRVFAAYDQQGSLPIKTQLMRPLTWLAACRYIYS